MSCPTFKNLRTLMKLLLHADTQHFFACLSSSTRNCRAAPHTFVSLLQNAEVMLQMLSSCQGGYGGGEGGGGGFNGGYRSRNDIEQATEVKRSREAGVDENSAEPSFRVPRSYSQLLYITVHYSHCLHSTLLHRIP